MIGLKDVTEILLAYLSVKALGIGLNLHSIPKTSSKPQTASEYYHSAYNYSSMYI